MTKRNKTSASQSFSSVVRRSTESDVKLLRSASCPMIASVSSGNLVAHRATVPVFGDVMIGAIGGRPLECSRQPVCSWAHGRPHRVTSTTSTDHAQFTLFEALNETRVSDRNHRSYLNTNSVSRSLHGLLNIKNCQSDSLLRTLVGAPSLVSTSSRSHPGSTEGALLHAVRPTTAACNRSKLVTPPLYAVFVIVSFSL